MKLLGRFEENSSAQCARKCQNANTPAAYKFFTVAQHYFITGLSFGTEYISLYYVTHVYSSHHLSFGHTSPQLVGHGIHELAQKMNMMIVLISPIFIIYHLSLFVYISHIPLVFGILEKHLHQNPHVSVLCSLLSRNIRKYVYTAMFKNMS